MTLLTPLEVKLLVTAVLLFVLSAVYFVLEHTNNTSARTRRRLKDAHESEAGSLIIETALVLPVICMLILGGIDIDRACGARNKVGFLSTQGVVCAQQQGCDPVGYGMSSAHGLGLDPSKLTVTYNTKAVTVSYIYTPLSPFFKQQMTLTQTASLP